MHHLSRDMASMVKGGLVMLILFGAAFAVWFFFIRKKPGVVQAVAPAPVPVQPPDPQAPPAATAPAPPPPPPPPAVNQTVTVNSPAPTKSKKWAWAVAVIALFVLGIGAAVLKDSFLGDGESDDESESTPAKKGKKVSEDDLCKKCTAKTVNGKQPEEALSESGEVILIGVYCDCPKDLGVNCMAVFPQDDNGEFNKPGICLTAEGLKAYNEEVKLSH